VENEIEINKMERLRLEKMAKLAKAKAIDDEIMQHKQDLVNQLLTTWKTDHKQYELE